MNQLILIAHNLRSTHNVGSLLRTAEGLGVETVYLTGYTPFPLLTDDPRLPHIARKLDAQIHKTALGAETMIDWHAATDLKTVLKVLHDEGWTIAAIEQSTNSLDLSKYAVPDKIAIIVGREVEGLEPEILAACDLILEIPMFGKKESFNVVQAAAMALYHCRFNHLL